MRPEEVPARPECPEPTRWIAPDGNATEVEVSALIGAFVTALKPDYVVETGSYWGDTTEVIGKAIRELGRGWLVSIDNDLDMIQVTKRRVQGLPVTLVLSKGSDFTPSQPIDLLFVDCALEDRLVQVRKFKKYASPRCVILMHDSAIWDAAEGIPEFYAEMAQAVEDGIVHPWVKLPTPRGLAITRYA